MLEGAGSTGRDCGARVQSCVVGQCACASGCQSPGISRVLDSWEHNADKAYVKGSDSKEMETSGSIPGSEASS